MLSAVEYVEINSLLLRFSIPLSPSLSITHFLRDNIRIDWRLHVSAPRHWIYILAHTHTMHFDYEYAI